MNMLNCRKLPAVPLFVLSAAVLVTACSEDSFQFTKGSPVSFIAGSGGDTFTRTSYSGELDGGRERVDWEEGDLIRIYCSAVSEPSSKYADYRISAGSINADGAISEANIEGLGGIGLHWGDEDSTHTFYAVYPSPATPALLSGGVESDVLSDGQFSGHVDAVQTPLSIVGSSSPYTAVPDLTSEYMLARTVISAGDRNVSGDDVYLSFMPVVTAIEFTIRNDYANGGDLLIKSVSLESESHSLSGPFCADMTALGAGGYPSVSLSGSTGSPNGKTVSIDFTSHAGGNITIAKGEDLVFTFFLLPESDIDDLTFRIDRPDGSWVSTRLATLGSSGYEGLLFPQFKKTYVKGILVPKGAKWSTKNTDMVTSWVFSSETPYGLILGHSED